MAENHAEGQDPPDPRAKNVLESVLALSSEAEQLCLEDAARFLGQQTDRRALIHQITKAFRKLADAFGHAGAELGSLLSFPLLSEALRSRAPRDALRLIRREDPDSLATRVRIVGLLAGGFVSLDSPEGAITRMERWIRFWEENRTSLIASGMSSARLGVYDGQDVGRIKLYPTRPLPCPSQPPAPQPARRLSAPLSLGEVSLRLSLLRGCCPAEYAGCACEDPFLRQPDAEDIARLEGDRERMFDLTLAVY